jgi:hypothetical protein
MRHHFVSDSNKRPFSKFKGGSLFKGQHLFEGGAYSKHHGIPKRIDRSTLYKDAFDALRVLMKSTLTTDSLQIY